MEVVERLYVLSGVIGVCILVLVKVRSYEPVLILFVFSGLLISAPDSMQSNLQRKLTDTQVMIAIVKTASPEEMYRKDWQNKLEQLKIEREGLQDELSRLRNSVYGMLLSGEQ